MVEWISDLVRKEWHSKGRTELKQIYCIAVIMIMIMQFSPFQFSSVTLLDCTHQAVLSPS
jgi:hypothetical protein